MKKAIIIHGWDDNPSLHWLPWLGKQLDSKGWEVHIPEMPNSKEPKFDEWMHKLQSLSPDENTVLVGHSLANALIMKYLEQNKVKAAYMVAAWDWLIESFKEFHETFFLDGFAYDSIKKTATPITVINSTNDKYIDFDKGKELGQKLDAEFIAVDNAGHFTGRDGYGNIPLLLDKILEDTR